MANVQYAKASSEKSRSFFSEVAEWFKATDYESVVGLILHREFESRSLHQARSKTLRAW